MWLLEDGGDFHAGLPKPHVELVVSLSGIHWWRAARGAPEHRYASAWVTPIQRGPRFARAVGRRHLIGARLEPWAAIALFGLLPPGDGRPPPRLHELIDGEARRLRRRLLRAADDRERFARLAAWLEAQPALRRVAPAGLARSATDATAGGLARTAQLSSRTLRRRFAQEAGISPKRWLRLRRLDAVLRDAERSVRDQSLAEFALAHGYADQAHLSREIAELTGATPAELRRRAPGSPPHLFPGG